MKKTNPQLTHYNKKLELFGWLIALEGLIGTFLQQLFPQFMLSGGVELFFTLSFLILCFLDRNLLKKQGNWKKNKIAWGWCLFPPVYLYKRAWLLKESLLKFWIYMITTMLSIMYIISVVNNLLPLAINGVYNDCMHELSQYDVSRDNAEDICWSKQIMFSNCIYNFMDQGADFNVAKDVCNNNLASRINPCVAKIGQETDEDLETALLLCTCALQYDPEYCLEKYGFTN